ncbi:UPF0103-domain-containing protein [Venturia nashicola]|uniref:UPF0103-domain-containing protein n=1 Tax=Venturia nashicola TaxID=86259 RepID=A0A4Z1PKF7_9PEZI|nr:UPF0103-domain-containing protein [Venturia nashicola]TLD35680.1 UPF0103-domain-containing protein [Venturia nashicola]
MSREATHAGTWYTDDRKKLDGQLDGWLADVPNQIPGIASTSKTEPPVSYPVKGARVIIAPHAGYSYSGPAAAWAYKAVDWSKCKRVFLLGPAHHIHLRGCALSKLNEYETPLGDLVLCPDTINKLRITKKFTDMSQRDDEDEHSLEMHLPYIYKMLEIAGRSPMPKLVPILVGNITATQEAEYGELLAPFLKDPTTVFIASSDFCHWGTRFGYTYYQPTSSPSSGIQLGGTTPKDPPIHESIKVVDHLCMDAIETGSHQAFTGIIAQTRNTVCGRHPIGVVMAALEVLEKRSSQTETGRFKFVRYERSDLCRTMRDSSVSYCSAYAVLPEEEEK